MCPIFVTYGYIESTSTYITLPESYWNLENVKIQDGRRRIWKTINFATRRDRNIISLSIYRFMDSRKLMQVLVL